MATNETIIKAAGQAYAPVKGQYDLSGFINGVAAVAQGFIKREEVAKKRKKDSEEVYLPTDNTVVAGIVQGYQANVADGTMTLSQAKFNLKQLEYDQNNTLPKINALVTDLVNKGVSNYGNEIDASYIQGLQLGVLDNPINVNGVQVSTFYSVDANNKLLVMGPEGEYIRPNLLKGMLANTPTIQDRDPANAVITSFIKGTYIDGENSKFPAAVNSFVNSINSAMENENTKFSFLLDNPKGHQITDKLGEVQTIKWTEYYLQEGLDEYQKEVFKKAMSSYNDETREKATAIIVKKLMKEDKNLNSDIDGYINKFVTHKTPKDVSETVPISKPTLSGFVIKGKMTKSEKQDLNIIKEIETSIDDLAAGVTDSGKKLNWKSMIEKGTSHVLMGGAVLLTPDPTRSGAFYFEKNMKGATTEDQYGESKPSKGAKYSKSFNPKTQSEEGRIEILKSVLQDVPGGLSFGSTIYENYIDYRKSIIPTKN